MFEAPGELFVVGPLAVFSSLVTDSVFIGGVMLLVSTGEMFVAFDVAKVLLFIGV